MTDYNVAVRIVDIVAANDPETALANLKRRVEAAGFDVLDGDAFESELLPETTERRP